MGELLIYGPVKSYEFSSSEEKSWRIPALYRACQFWRASCFPEAVSGVRITTDGRVAMAVIDQEIHYLDGLTGSTIRPPLEALSFPIGKLVGDIVFVLFRNSKCEWRPISNYE